MAIPYISLPPTSSSRLSVLFRLKYSNKDRGRKRTGVWHGDLLTLEINFTVHDASGNRQTIENKRFGVRGWYGTSACMEWGNEPITDKERPSDFARGISQCRVALNIRALLSGPRAYSSDLD